MALPSTPRGQVQPQREIDAEKRPHVQFTSQCNLIACSDVHSHQGAETCFPLACVLTLSRLSTLHCRCTMLRRGAGLCMSPTSPKNTSQPNLLCTTTSAWLRALSVQLRQGIGLLREANLTISTPLRSRNSHLLGP